MLPATVALWLGLEITGFALLFDSSLGGGAFALKGATPTLPFAHRQRVVLDRVADRLGYERPEPLAAA